MFCHSVSVIMEAMRQSWSDDRLDDLKDRVDAGFAQVDQRFAHVEERFARLDAKIDSKIDAVSAELRQEMKMGFDQINSRFDAMQQTIIRVGGGLIGVLIAGLVATQI
jgi:tetrahydromethanopterin S-methyltransferase subunit G